MAGMMKGLFGSREMAELTPEVEQMIDQSEFLIRVVKKQMRSTGIMGNLSYHGQLDDSIGLVERDIELLKKGKANQKNIDALVNHRLSLETCAVNLMPHFDEEFAIQNGLRKNYLKEKQKIEQEKEALMSGRAAAAAMPSGDGGQGSFLTVDPELVAEEEAVWEMLYNAADAVHNSREITDRVSAGEVSAAVLSKSGRIYTGVCVDMPCALGICAERNALLHMITEGETEITKVAVIMPDGKAGVPCGACREFMAQLMPETYMDVQIILDYETMRVVTLGEM